MRPATPIAAGLLLALFALAAPGHGQALRNHDENAPVDVNADRIEVQDRADRAVFSGNVKMVQGGLSLDAARLTVAYSGSAGSGDNVQVQRLDASGGVTVRSATETARGDFAIYDLNARRITMLGNVVLNQKQSVVRGGRLVIDLDSGRAVVDGKNASSPGIGGGPGGRVSGRFTVPKRTQNPGATPTPTPQADENKP